MRSWNSLLTPTEKQRMQTYKQKEAKQHTSPSIRILAELGSGFAPGTEPHSWRGPTGTTLTYLDDVDFPVSSSAVREQLRRGETPAMLPPAVFAYIQAHRLYGWQRPA